MKHGRFVDKENIISYNRNFVRRLRLRALMHWINTIALLKRGQATRAVIFLPFQKVGAAVLHPVSFLPIHTRSTLTQWGWEKTTTCWGLIFGRKFEHILCFRRVLAVTLRSLACFSQQELGDSSSTAELPMVSLRHLLLKMWSHKIPLRLLGWQSMDLCSNRLSFSADKQKPKWKTYLLEIFIGL